MHPPLTHINDEHIDTAENLDIVMNMHNLLEYSDNYVDTSESLLQFKRDESPMNKAGHPINVATNKSSSFKHLSSILGEATVVDGNDRSLKNVKIVVPLR